MGDLFPDHVWSDHLVKPASSRRKRRARRRPGARLAFLEALEPRLVLAAQPFTVRYDEVYDGIDLEFYGRDGHL